MDELSRLIAEIQRLRQDMEKHASDFEVRTETTREIVKKLEDLRRRADAIEAAQDKARRPGGPT